MDLQDFSLEPLKEELSVASVGIATSVSLVASDDLYSGSVPLTPSAVKTLVEQGVKVFIQFGFSKSSTYTDAEYAEAGAEFVEKFADLAILGKVIIKYNAFTLEQLLTIPKEKIVFTVVGAEHISVEYVNILNVRNLTSFSADLINSETGDFIVHKIEEESLSRLGFSVVLSSFILPLVETLLFSPSIAQALQMNPLVCQGIFTHLSWLCSRDIALRLGIEWRDLLSLCWDLN